MAPPPSINTLLRLLSEARSIGLAEAAPLRPSTDHVSGLSAHERWLRLVNDARSIFRESDTR